MVASPGRSGGAAGSSQSPNWNRPSHSSRGPARESSTSTQSRMLSYWATSTPRSPNRSCSTCGITVAASPHAAAGVAACSRTFGTMNGTTPSCARCSSARSVSHEARKPSQSNRYVAVGANTWMSPVQPSRSSRWGQSVGTCRKLPRIPHTTFSCSRSTSSEELSNQPVRRMSVCTTTATTAAGSSSPGQPSTCT
ncbi:hypothetical protein BJF90_44940 [Pseudonocardia sp. CNS-004]|nr:hypothetical protein BJF90_44940 [Pseudonocardia sp. CNS-004]